MALMKKLSGSSWGADHNIQKKLYKGRVRPVLEYGISSWRTAAKTNFQRFSKDQNQASRFMIGALRLTPIYSMETPTGLQSMEERRDTRLLTQPTKFKRLENPMHNRMYTPTKGRLKRSSFIHQERILERKDSELMDHTNKPIPTHCTLPVWKRTQFPLIRDSIMKKGIQTDAEQNRTPP